MALLRVTLLAVGTVLMIVATGPQHATAWQLPVKAEISACPFTQVPVTELVTFTARDLVVETVVSEDTTFRFSTFTSTSTLTSRKHVCDTYIAEPVGPAPTVVKTHIVPFTINYRNIILTQDTTTITTTEVEKRTKTSYFTPTVTEHRIDTYITSVQYTVVTYTQKDDVTALTTTTYATKTVTEEMVATEWITRTRTVTNPVPVLITMFPTLYTTLPLTMTLQVTKTVCEATSW